MQREILNQVLKILHLVEQPWFPLSPGSPWRSLAGLAWAPDSHQLRPEAVDDGTQGQAAPPGGGQIRDVHVLVALGLLLAPG